MKTSNVQPKPTAPTTPRKGDARPFLWLDEPLPKEAGGKATGLAQLVQLGLKVPEGFVLLNPQEATSSNELERAYAFMGEPVVAVRSSAVGEDGRQHSFAGQYETILNVQGIWALREAVTRCIASTDTRRARSYQEHRAGAGGRMAVVVQRMVEPAAAGVLFTADALGLTDRVVVEAVRGLGEALVSGQANADQYILAKTDGNILHQDMVAHTPILTHDQLRTMLRQALSVEDALGYPVDMEWALDRSGRLYWLQARPVTALPGDMNEFDVNVRPRRVYTKANFGEMMPGAMDPLSMSTTGYAVDQALQLMFIQCGVRAKRQKAPMSVAIFAGQMIFDLNSVADEFCVKVAGSSADRLAIAILGHTIPELRQPGKAPSWIRTINGLRYARYILAVEHPIRQLEQEATTFCIEPGPMAIDTWKAIDAGLEMLVHTHDVHMRSSAGSGVAIGIIEEILSRRGTDQAAAITTDLLAATGNVESANLVSAFDDLAQLVAQHPIANRFVQAAPNEAIDMLRHDPSVAHVFSAFLERHGHRAFRELSMRQQSWADDPRPLVDALQTSIQASLHVGTKRPKGTSHRQTEHGKVMEVLAKWTRAGVRRREFTKGLLVLVTNTMKRAYRQLGKQLIREGRIDSVDDVFFYSHSELGKIAAGRMKATQAARRRAVFERQQLIDLPHHFVGIPVPVAGGTGSVRELTGRPVSAGRVEGRARVVRTLEEATELHPGEILIAPVTDVGWTPYFNVIAGLATDVGSAMSHGAVVAREYGIPAVVSLKTATAQFETGQMVVLDGSKGTLSISTQR